MAFKNLEMKYYKLIDDIEYPRRWYLDEIQDVDNWSFTKPESIIPHMRYEINVDPKGKEMHFCTTDAFVVPIVSSKLKDILSDIPGLAFFPVKMINMNTVLQYFIMQIQNAYDCVDEQLSNFEKYKENDPVRPDKAGQYSGFVKLVVDTRKNYPSPIFRVKKANLLIIVNEVFKDKVESELPNSGMIFIPAY
jgi:hypothetical protein